MTKMDISTQKFLEKFGIGFQPYIDMFRQVESLIPQALDTTYPPFNIKKYDDNKYCIELAVAGFGTSNIDIEMADNTLTISGKIETESSDDDSCTYLYKGIANRQFTRKIALADMVEVKNAEMINGMLRVWLEQLVPEHKKSRKIEVKTGGSKNAKKD